jgi:hypothetical protein
MSDDQPFAEFIRRIRSGDAAAAAELIRRYEPEVRLEVRMRLSAMAALRRAVAEGFTQFEVIRNNPDLAPLRSRANFQALLLDLPFPADPFAR